MEELAADNVFAKPQPDPNSSDEDSDRETEESIRKKREWDDWKDNHKRGEGNTYNQG